MPFVLVRVMQRLTVDHSLPQSVLRVYARFWSGVNLYRSGFLLELCEDILGQPWGCYALSHT